MAKRRWTVKYDKKNGCWVAFPHGWPVIHGAWAFTSWQDALDYANSNGKRIDIKHNSPARF